MKTICILLLTIIGCAPIAGCRVIWTDDIFAASLFSDLVAEEGKIKADPNGLTVEVGGYKSESQSIAVEVDPVTRALRLKTD